MSDYYPSAHVIPGVTSASAYSAFAAIGSAFPVRMQIGQNNGLLAQMHVYDNGTANGPILFHFFGRPPSAQVNGATFTLADTDRWHYMGYASASTWISAGTARLLSQVNDVHLAMYNLTGDRAVYAQAVALGSLTFGATASAQAISLRPLYD